MTPRLVRIYPPPPRVLSEYFMSLLAALPGPRHLYLFSHGMDPVLYNTSE